MKRNFCVIDLETKGLSARPESFALGCVYGWNDKGQLIKKHFTDREEMIKYLFSQRDFKYIFAHNSEYDLTCLFDNIILYLDNSALFVGSMFIRAVKNGKVFMNSLSILKSSVEQLGKASGRNKMVLSDKFKNAQPGDVIKIDQYDIDYCFEDCGIIYDYLVEIFAFTEKLKPTIASCSMEIFLKKFLLNNFTENPLNETFRNSYYGGRVECFRMGKIKPIYKYDINSLYPFVCTKMVFPDFSKIKKGQNLSVHYFKNFILKNFEGTAHVKINHKYNFVGCLPYRKMKKTNNFEIIYPYGTFSGWWNFNELRYAVNTGLVEILEVKEYLYSPPFYFKELSDYMKYFFEKKNTTQGAQKLIYKFLLNALTGKFGQKDYGSKRYFPKLLEAMEFLKEKNLKKTEYVIHYFGAEREDVFLEIFKKRKSKIRSKWNIPTISSYITSEARIYMLNYYLKYQNELLYTDTDSLVLKKPIYESSIIGDNLGQFKKEDDKEIHIFGNKHYKTDKGLMLKGVHKKHRKRNGKFYFKKMIRTKEGLRRIDKDIHSGMFVTIHKELTNDYTKRIINKNKTKPINLSL